MLVPEICKKSDHTKLIEKDNSIILEVNENLCIDFKEKYLDIVENDKEMDKYIKYIERLVRKSYEYRTYIGVLKERFELNQCAFFRNMDFNEMHIKRGLEFHHYPFTLYDIVSIVIQNRIIDVNEDPGNQKKFNKVYNPFSIAKEVLRLHFQNKVGLCPLSLTPHKLFHKGNLFIPLTEDFIFGNWGKFEDEYDLSSGNYSEILKLLRSKTDEILSKGNFVIEKLQIKRVYIKMDSTEKLQKIVIDEEENIEE